MQHGKCLALTLNVLFLLALFLLALESPAFAQESAAQESEPHVEASPGPVLWEAPWDPGSLYLPPVGSLDFLYRYRETELGGEHLGALTLSIPLDKTAGDAETEGVREAAAEATPPRITDSATLTETVMASHESRATRRDQLLQLSRAIVALVRQNSPELGPIAELESAQSRSRTSGLLPELRLRGAHGIDQSVAPSTSGIYAAPLTTKGGWDTAFEVRMTFRLAKLLYEDGESSLLSMKQKLRTQIEARVEEAVQNLAKFHGALRRLRVAEPESEEELRAQLAKDEALLELDRLTNGAAVVLIEKYLGDVIDLEPKPALPLAPSRPE